MKNQFEDAAATRLRYVEQLSALRTHVPELHSEDREIYEQVAEFEQLHVAPNLEKEDFLLGTAMYPDEIKTVNFGNSVLISADHATNPVRFSTGEIGDADHGTAGLGAVLAQKRSGTVTMPIGRQTANANVTRQHPLKDELGVLMPNYSSFISLHGMKPGKFFTPRDTTEIHAVIGLGANPSEKMLDLSSDFKKQTKSKYGLQVAIGNTERFFDDPNNDGVVRYDEAGNPIYSARLAALGPGTTTNFVRSQVVENFPALQIEISRTLRLLPKELEYRSEREKIISVYMGYCMANKLIDFVQTAGSA